jgi:hypothetical protein
LVESIRKEQRRGLTGGKNGFGAAMLVGREVATVTVSTVAEALDWAVERCGSRIPVAAGDLPTGVVADNRLLHVSKCGQYHQPVWRDVSRRHRAGAAAPGEVACLPS